VISQGLPIYMALEPVDMRMGYERLGGLVRERMRAAPAPSSCTRSWTPGSSSYPKRLATVISTSS
jgi:hypothetical protein